MHATEAFIDFLLCLKVTIIVMYTFLVPDIVCWIEELQFSVSRTA